jgi:hypothetical protein
MTSAQLPTSIRLEESATAESQTVCHRKLAKRSERWGPHPVEIRVRVLGHVIVNYDIDPLDIDTPSDKVSGHENPLQAVLEVLVPVQPAKGNLTRVRGYVRKKRLCQGRSTGTAYHSALFSMDTQNCPMGVSLST